MVGLPKRIPFETSASLNLLAALKIQQALLGGSFAPFRALGYNPGAGRKPQPRDSGQEKPSLGGRTQILVSELTKSSQKTECHSTTRTQDRGHKDTPLGGFVGGSSPHRPATKGTCLQIAWGRSQKSISIIAGASPQNGHPGFRNSWQLCHFWREGGGPRNASRLVDSGPS